MINKSYLKKSYIGIQVIPVPKKEQELEIYQLLEENCDLIFCKHKHLDNLLFECNEQFAIFATNKRGGYFGTIGGIGNLEDDDYPIGYVNNANQCGRIADNLKQLLKLVVFYPFWVDLLNCEEKEIDEKINCLEEDWSKIKVNYFKNQKQISDILQIEKDENSIRNLFINLKRKPYFTVNKTNTEKNPYHNFLI